MRSKSQTVIKKEELAALNKLGRIVGSLENYQHSLNQIAESLAEIAKVDVCSLYLVDADKKELVLRASKGLSKRAIGKVRAKLDEGILGKVASERTPLAVDNVKKNSLYQDIPGIEDAKTVSALVLPLLIKDKLIGVLDLHSHTLRKYTKKEVQLFSEVAREIAFLAKGAKLFDETKKSLLEHQVLYQIGLLLTSAEKIDEVLNVIVQSGIRIVGTPAGSLALYDEENQEFYLAVSVGFAPAFSRISRWKLRLGGLTSRIINQRVPLVIPDASLNPAFDNPVMIKEGIKSLVAVPLIAVNRIVGILYVDDFVPREFTSTEVAILSLLANQATIAIMRAQLLEQTKKLAITDGLTEVFNHRYFQERMDEEIKRAERYHHPLSLIVLDIDYFKKYNDTYGHPRGDIVLKGIARILTDVTREVDIVARYGGEEFVIILPETERSDAMAVARKIRKGVENYPFPSEESQPHGRITVSLGVATYPYDAASKEDLISRTDKAMYLAKAAGRNKVHTFRKARIKT